MPHGGRNFRLMVLCHGGALLHSKNNAMFIKHFKPWAEVIRTRFVTNIFLQFVLLAAMKVYVMCGLSTSHGVDSSVCCSTAMR